LFSPWLIELPLFTKGLRFYPKLQNIFEMVVLVQPFLMFSSIHLNSNHRDWFWFLGIIVYFFVFLLILNRVERIDLFPMKWSIFVAGNIQKRFWNKYFWQ